MPERQVLLWTLTAADPRVFLLGMFPIFSLEAPEGRFYGFPVHGIPGFKIGKYHHTFSSVSTILDRMDRDCPSCSTKYVLRVGIPGYFLDADGPNSWGMKTCLFTNSPDEHFITGSPGGQSPQVGFAAGFSGHGFKFCSVVGEIMTELMLDTTTRLNIGMFR